LDGLDADEWIAVCDKCGRVGLPTQPEHDDHSVEVVVQAPEEKQIATDGGQSTSGVERLSVAEIEEIIEDVEAEVLAEDKHGASRNDVVEGTCQRIVRRVRDEHTGADQMEADRDV
jgi:hypothetical protein